MKLVAKQEPHAYWEIEIRHKDNGTDYKYYLRISSIRGIDYDGHYKTLQGAKGAASKWSGEKIEWEQKD